MPVGAQRFEDGDVEAFAVEKGRDRFAGADPAHAQRRQAHQGQEHGDLFDKAANAGRGVGAVADLPTGIGKSLSGLGLEAFDGDAGPERQAIEIIDQAAFLHQAGGGQCFVRNQQMRAQGKSGGDAVRLLVQRGDDTKRGAADPDKIAASDMQAVKEALFRRRAADAVILAGQHVA